MPLPADVDIPLVVDTLVPGAIYTRAKTYTELENTWQDPRPIPTEGEIEAAWPDIQAEVVEEQRVTPLLEDFPWRDAIVALILEDTQKLLELKNILEIVYPGGTLLANPRE